MLLLRGSGLRLCYVVPVCALDGLGWLVGLIMAVVVFSVLVGGIKPITKVTEKIVPFMAVFYCLFAVIVILMNYASL